MKKERNIEVKHDSKNKNFLYYRIAKILYNQRKFDIIHINVIYCLVLTKTKGGKN